MELRFERVLSGFGKYEYQLTRNGRLIETAYPRKGCDKHHLSFSLEGLQKEYFLNIRNVYGKKSTEDNIVFRREAATIISDDQEVGKICECIKKGKHFWDGIGITEVYWEDGSVYSLYSVGFGHKGGIYLCFYLKNELVAEVMLHKKYGAKTTYSFYAKDDVPMELLVISTINWDIVNWFESGNGGYILNTWQKELKEKFDPVFIEKYKEHGWN